MMLLENAPLFYYRSIQPSIYHHLSVLSIILSIYCSVTLSIFCSINHFVVNHFVVNQSTWCRCHFVALLLFYLSFCLSLRLLLCQCIILFLICYSSYHSVALLLYCSITLSTALFFFFLSIYWISFYISLYLMLYHSVCLTLNMQLIKEFQSTGFCICVSINDRYVVKHKKLSFIWRKFHSDHRIAVEKEDLSCVLKSKRLMQSKRPSWKSRFIVVSLGRSLDCLFSTLDAKETFSHVALRLELLLTSLAPCSYKAIFRPHRNLLLRDACWKEGSALMTCKHDIYCIKNTRPQISRDLVMIYSGI